MNTNNTFLLIGRTKLSENASESPIQVFGDMNSIWNLWYYLKSNPNMVSLEVRDVYGERKEPEKGIRALTGINV